MRQIDEMDRCDGKMRQIDVQKEIDDIMISCIHQTIDIDHDDDDSDDDDIVASSSRAKA